MRWPWQRPKREPDDAERQLADAQARDPEIEEVAERLEQLRRQNRFAAMIEEALREHR